MNRCVRAVCAGVLGTLLAACGIVESDDPLETQLSTVRDGGQAVPLRGVTDFGWDEVHLFNEYTDKDVIENVVGEPVISADYHAAGSLLVFEERGAVVKTVTITGDYLRADGNTFGSDVLVVPNGAGALRLEDPR
jgi:hypothetical protein